MLLTLVAGGRMTDFMIIGKSSVSVSKSCPRPASSPFSCQLAFAIMLFENDFTNVQQMLDLTILIERAQLHFR